MAKRSYRQHGLNQAKRLLNEYGSRAIDGRTSTGRALQAWRDTLVDELGGPDAISAQQATLIEEAAKIKLLLSGIDVWLLSQDRPPVDKRSRKMWQVVKDTMALRNTLVQIMGQLGLEKRKPPAQDLTAYVEERYGGAGCPGRPARRCLGQVEYYHGRGLPDQRDSLRYILSPFPVAAH